MAVVEVVLVVLLLVGCLAVLVEVGCLVVLVVVVSLVVVLLVVLVVLLLLVCCSACPCLSLASRSCVRLCTI